MIDTFNNVQKLIKFYGGKNNHQMHQVEVFKGRANKCFSWRNFVALKNLHQLNGDEEKREMGRMIIQKRDLTFLLRNPEGIKTNGGAAVASTENSLGHDSKKCLFCESV